MTPPHDRRDGAPRGERGAIEHDDATRTGHTGLAKDTVVLVCRGNLARSPLAAGLLRADLARHGRTGIAVESAGTHASPLSRIPASVMEVAAELGLDLTDHRPRRMSTESISGAELIVTMTEAQRSAVVRLSPAAISRVFTLLELCRLLAPGDGSVGSCAALAAVAHRARPVTRPAAALEDVPDPIGMPVPQLRRTARQIHHGVSVLSGYLVRPDRSLRVATDPL